MKIINKGELVFIGKEKINLKDFPNLKVLGCNMTGIEHIPTEECEERGIKVISLSQPRDSETEKFLSTISSTAEHTIGLMIALLRNYKTLFTTRNKERDFYKGHTLNGKTLRIVGYGRIGKQVGAIAKAFGMKVVTTGFYGNVDIVSLHIPLKGNEGFFTKEMFSRMKPSSYFINTSRNGVVEKGALLWALENEKIAGAAVDFIDDPELVEYSKKSYNLILTPHIGGNTFEDTERTEKFIERKVKKYLQKNV